MKLEQNVYALVYAFLLLLFFAVGALFLSAAYSEFLRISLSHFFLHAREFLFSAGLVVVTLTSALIALSWKMHKKRYFQVNMECDKLTVEKAVIDEYVTGYFRKKVPDKECVYEIGFAKDGNLEIVLDLTLEGDEHESRFFSDIQTELGAILARKIGYQKPFVVTVVER